MYAEMRRALCAAVGYRAYDGGGSVSFPQVDDQARRDALLAEATEEDRETLDLFAAGVEAYAAASVEVWEPPTRVSNTSGIERQT